MASLERGKGRNRACTAMTGEIISFEQAWLALDEHVEVVAYDPAWSARAEEETGRLRVVLGHRVREILHIGSTAVPGLAAKPIVDLQAGIVKPTSVAVLASILTGSSYEDLGEAGVSGRRYFRRRRAAVPSENVHLVWTRTLWRNNWRSATERTQNALNRSHTRIRAGKSPHRADSPQKRIPITSTGAVCGMRACRHALYRVLHCQHPES